MSSSSSKLVSRLRERLLQFQRSELPWRTTALTCVVALLVIVALWVFPVWQVTHTPGTTAANHFDREDAARKTLAQIIGGVVILGGLFMSVRTFGLSREGQITDRFTKGIEQLGKTNGDQPNIEVRLGAIYALERIAIDSPRDHWTIMEILTAYIRQNAPRLPDRPHIPGEKLRTEIQAILTVLGRRRIGSQRERPGHKLYLSHSNLVRANLHKALLRDALLEGAYLRKAHLYKADLQGAYMGGCYLQEANLDSANLQQADLSDANLQWASLQQANLQGASLAHADLPRAIFAGANLTGANLNYANLQGASFREANLQAANLQGCNLADADLQGASLLDASFENADLSRATLREVTGLTVQQLRVATGWELATYSHTLREALGLAPEAETST